MGDEPVVDLARRAAAVPGIGRATPGPLHGIRVLDLTWRLSGPYGTMLLADLGAEVIKVEPPPDGEVTRLIGPFVETQSTYFVGINRGKKSVCLDFRTEAGRELLLRLAEVSDVAVENYIPGTLDRHGVGYEAMRQRNRGIIYAAISGFGQTGPDRDLPAFDIIAQGMSGMLSITGHPDGPPARTGISLGDIAAGVFATLGILGALIERQSSGMGQFIDVAMLDCQVALMENAFSRYLMANEVQRRIGSRHPLATPFQAFETRDGYVVVALRGTEGQWDLFCSAIDRLDLMDDPRFLTNELRTQNHAILEPLINEATRTKTTAEWVATFRELGIPCGPVNDIQQAAEMPQLHTRHMFIEGEQPGAGPWIYVNSPIRASRTPVGVRGPAPLAGEHTSQVLRDLLGMDEATIAKLIHDGVIADRGAASSA